MTRGNSLEWGPWRKSGSGREDEEFFLGILEKAVDVSFWPSRSPSGLETFR